MAPRDETDPDTSDAREAQPQRGSVPAPHAAQWDPASLRAFGHAVVEQIVEHLGTIDTKPVYTRPAAQARSFFASPLGTEGTPMEELLEEFSRFIAPYPMGNGHRRFFGWVNSPPDPLGMYARLLAAAMNPSVAGGDQSAILVERQVIDWFVELFEFPETSMGLLTSGGSMATLLALTAARQRAALHDPRTHGLAQDTAPLLVYASAEGHSCIQKSVELLGIGSDHLRAIRTDRTGAIDVQHLEHLLAEDRAAGRARPLAVCASVGTASTGAVDPIGAIAEVCATHGIWLHLDGAYGGVCAWLEEFASLRAEVRRADSLAVDPHKWLGVPVDTGLVLVRHPDALRQAFELVPDYLRDDDALPKAERTFWYSHHGFEQTRAFRALPVWMTLKQRGTDAIRSAIERDLAVARHFARALRAAEDIELWEPQGLGIVCFRLRADPSVLDPALDPALDKEEERWNRDLLLALQRGGRFYPTGTVIDGRFFLRACFLHPRTTLADTEAFLDEVRRVWGRVRDQAGEDLGEVQTPPA